MNVAMTMPTLMFLLFDVLQAYLTPFSRRQLAIVFRLHSKMAVGVGFGPTRDFEAPAPLARECIKPDSANPPVLVSPPRFERELFESKSKVLAVTPRGRG